MKKWFWLLLAAMCFILTACDGGKESVRQPVEAEITLCADFSMGQAAAETDPIRRRTETVPEVTVEILAERLSDWTGLDFILGSVTLKGKVVTVDWAEDSTLIAGLDDRRQKEDFFFYDVVSLNWFMLDSLYQTLMANLDVEEVYYTMNNGQDLILPGMEPAGVFPADLTYKGSAFYCSPTENPGEEIPELASDPPVLMRTGSFTGLVPLEANNDFHGGYYYSDQTEDGLTVIINCSFSTVMGPEEALEDYLFWTASEITKTAPQAFTAIENETHTQRMGWPVWLLSWQSDEAEELRQWEAFFFMTDTHTYLYAFGAPESHAADMQDVWQEVFEGLFLS